MTKLEYEAFRLAPADRPQLRSETETVNPREIAFATATFYRAWEPSTADAVRDATDVDGIRGDLALKTLTAAKLNGFQIAVVDGGSSVAFRKALTETIGKPASDEEQKGMSPSRRQVFGEAATLDGVKVIAWVEPEKVTMAAGDNLFRAALPILQGQADVVIPKRDEFAFIAYPYYQTNWEKESNRQFNRLLKENGLLPEDSEDLDMWFGPRLFRNDPNVLKLFTYQWERDNMYPAQQNGTTIWEHDAEMNPDLWAGAIFLPVIAQLYKDKLDLKPPRVVGVEVDYIHSEEQKRTEQNSPTFQTKREQQSRNILHAAEALMQVFTYDSAQVKPLYRPIPR